MYRKDRNIRTFDYLNYEFKLSRYYEENMKMKWKCHEE